MIVDVQSNPKYNYNMPSDDSGIWSVVGDGEVSWEPTGGLFSGSIYVGRLQTASKSSSWKDEFFMAAMETFHRAFLAVEASAKVRMVETVLMGENTWDTLAGLTTEAQGCMYHEGKQKMLWTARVKMTDMNFGCYMCIPLGCDWVVAADRGMVSVKI